MLRLVKYLKSYVILILIAVVLLFVQANADLALPDYMSKIVNNGIQQGGIENAIPQAIRQSEMERLFLFMSSEEQLIVQADYFVVDEKSPDFVEIIKQYPTVAAEPIYVLKSIDKDEIARLNPIMGKSLLIVSGIEQSIADPAAAERLSQTYGFDLSQIPIGMDAFDMLQKLPASTLSQITDAINQKFTTLSDSTIAQMSGSIIKAEYVALGMDVGKVQTKYILHTGVLMLLVTLLSGVCTIAVGYLSARTAAGLSRDLRRKVFERVESFSSTEFDKFSTASLITRSTNDINQVQMVVLMLIRMVIYAPIIGVGGVIRALDKTTSMWWIIALAVVILLGLILTVFSIAMPRFKIIQSLIDRLNLVMRENLSGMMVIRAFNMQGFEEKRFDKANIDLTSVNLFINRVMVVMMPVIMLLMNAVTVLIIWVGAHEVAQSQMQVGDMMAFMQYAIQIVFAFLMLSMMFIMLPRAAVSGDRIADVLETEPLIKDPEKPREFPSAFKGTIEFHNVGFRYPGAEEDILHDINFSAKPGQTTAFIGTTGSGKSTIVNLIPRFYDVTYGSITLDGIDIREVTQHDLREKIGYIPQKGNLFSGTIESNLLYADENASDEDLKLAADIAQASEFIADPNRKGCIVRSHKEV